MQQEMQNPRNPVTYMKKLINQFRDPFWMAKKRYIKYYEELKIDNRCILLESRHGREMNGNMFYMMKYLSKSDKYKDFTIYLGVNAEKKEEFDNVLKLYGMLNVKLTVLSSDEYFRILASAKYLVNDTTYLPFFMKKEGQIYLNTWHGTPLKSLGKGVKKEAHAIGNIQKNFVSADYLLFPNIHTRDAILKDYMLENISNGSYIMAGYPRNEVFFDTKCREKLKTEIHLENKRIYAYMPTFRGAVRDVGAGTPQNAYYLNHYLLELDKQLQEDEIMYVNLHPFANKDVNFEEFQHIKEFPKKYETYEFLNIADVLVTDYSSVFFDFANSGRKIVLFTYDKEEYLNDRGMYLSIEDLPFPQVQNVEDLLMELRSEKKYDDKEFLEQFCKYENPFSSQKLCDYVFLGEDTGLDIYKIPNNGKENVLFYVGNLDGNGLTASFRNLMRSIDLSKRNYYFTFKTQHVTKNVETIFTFPEDVSYFAITGDPNITLWDRVWRKAFYIKWISADVYMKHQGTRVKQEFERKFGNARFEKVVQFSGYEDDIILEFSTFDGPKSIYVHNDMVQEIVTRGNQRRDVLKYAYNHFDHVAVVTEDIIQPTLEISGNSRNIKVAKNLINYQTILKKADDKIKLDSFTKTTMPEERLKAILNSDKERFINVGRFSPEKGHDRLVSAFQKYHEDHRDSYLVIMGGVSRYQGFEKLYDKILELELQDYVILLERVSNPYPIIKACDYFILSSLYEGFGIVLAEADILRLAVISTDISGPRGFMKKYGGTLVENSENGIYQGMEMLHSGLVKPMNVDYEAYNQEAIQEFENLLSN